MDAFPTLNWDWGRLAHYNETSDNVGQDGAGWPWCVDNKGQRLHMELIKPVWGNICFILMLWNFISYCLTLFTFSGLVFSEQSRKCRLPPVIRFLFCLLLQYLLAFLMCVFITGANVWWVSSSGDQAARSTRWPLGGCSPPDGWYIVRPHKVPSHQPSCFRNIRPVCD